MAGTEIGRLDIGIVFNSKDMDASLSDVERKAEKTGGVMQVALGNLVANAVQNVTAEVNGFASSILQTGMSFDATMSQVAAISGATEQDIAALTATAQEMGATTKFTATEAAEGLTYMAMAGWNTQQQMDGLPGIMNLAAAGGADLAEASDIVTDALTAFGQSASESARLADIMAAASSNSNTNIHMLGETFKYVAPVAGSLGYSMEDTSVAIGLMANAGIKGSQAGTALRTMLTNLAKPTDSMAAAMDELGISLTDSAGNMKPMSQLTNELRTAFGGLSASQKASYASTIAGKEGMSGLLAIVNAAPSDYDKLTEAINNSTGSAEQMADKMLDNLPGKMTLLSSAFDGVKMNIYNSFLPALTEGASGLGDFVSAIGAALSGEGDIQALLYGVTEQLGGALANGLAQLGSMVGNVLPVLLQAFAQLIPPLLSGLIEGAANLVSGVAAALPDLLPAIVDAIMGIAFVLTNPENIQMLIQAGIDLFMGLVDAIPEVIDVLVTQLPIIINNIVNSLIIAIPQLIQGAITLFHAIIDAIPLILPPLIAAIPQVLNTLITYLTNPETLEMLINAAVDLLTQIIMAVPLIVESLIPVLPTILETIIGFLLNPDTLLKLLDAATQLFLQLVLAVPKILGKLVEAFRNLVGRVWEKIQEMMGKFAENFGTFITDIFKGAINGMISFIENFLNTPIKLINGFIGIINDAFGWLGVNIGTISLIALPRLETGGIIPGDDYSGDHVIARVNSGEMVLTRGQQGALWNAIESGTFAGQEPETAGSNVDSWARSIASAFVDELDEREDADQRPIEVVNNNYFENAQDADQIGDIILESMRRATA